MFCFFFFFFWNQFIWNLFGMHIYLEPNYSTRIKTVSDVYKMYALHLIAALEYPRQSQLFLRACSRRMRRDHEHNRLVNN
uniref:Putative secreted protein n=1 Tax=Rhipicephalus microplus TaxID=6941 RepID=A0A6M2DBQ4_RHIMP